MITMLEPPIAPTVAEPQIVARLLGGLETKYDGVRVDAHLSAQSLLILAFLLVNAGETLRRDDVAFELWPDESEADAKAILRRALYLVQQAFPRTALALQCDKKTICWTPRSGAAWIDVVEFDALAADPNAFERAATLYRGDFAPRLDHEWAERMRDRLRNRAARLLETLIARYNERGDDRQALAYAYQLLEVDPWREDVLCTAMGLRHRLGDRAGALHAFVAFRARLGRELGVGPMPQTHATYQRICGNEESPVWPSSISN